jgi:hypothetical protein
VDETLLANAQSNTIATANTTGVAMALRRTRTATLDNSLDVPVLSIGLLRFVFLVSNCHRYWLPSPKRIRYTCR